MIAVNSLDMGKGLAAESGYRDRPNDQSRPYARSVISASRATRPRHSISAPRTRRLPRRVLPGTKDHTLFALADVCQKCRNRGTSATANLVPAKRNWQIASAGLLLLSLVLAVGIVWMSARTKVIPYVVGVDKLGHAVTTPTCSVRSPPRQDHRQRLELAFQRIESEAKCL